MPSCHPAPTTTRPAQPTTPPASPSIADDDSASGEMTTEEEGQTCPVESTASECTAEEPQTDRSEPEDPDDQTTADPLSDLAGSQSGGNGTSAAGTFSNWLRIIKFVATELTAGIPGAKGLAQLAGA